MKSVICAVAKFLTETELGSPSLAWSPKSMAFPQLCHGVREQGARSTSFSKGNSHGVRKRNPPQKGVSRAHSSVERLRDLPL